MVKQSLLTYRNRVSNLSGEGRGSTDSGGNFQQQQEEEEQMSINMCWVTLMHPG